MHAHIHTELLKGGYRQKSFQNIFLNNIKILSVKTFSLLMDKKNLSHRDQVKPRSEQVLEVMKPRTEKPVSLAGKNRELASNEIGCHK